MKISVDTKSAFDKIQHPFVTKKKSYQPRTRRNFLIQIRTYYKKLANIKLNSKMLKLSL